MFNSNTRYILKNILEFITPGLLISLELVFCSLIGIKLFLARILYINNLFLYTKSSNLKRLILLLYSLTEPFFYGLNVDSQLLALLCITLFAAVTYKIININFKILYFLVCTSLILSLIGQITWTNYNIIGNLISVYIVIKYIP